MGIDMTVQPMPWDEAYRIPRMTAAEAKASVVDELAEQARQAEAAEEARHEHCGAFHHGSCATDAFLRSEVARLEAMVARLEREASYWHMQAMHDDIQLRTFARRRAALPAELRRQDAEAQHTTTAAHAA